MPEDFWPEITPGRVRTPAMVLREQAGLLGPKTSNLVVGEVTGGQASGRLAKRVFVYRLNLVAPALGGYKYTAVSIYHGITPYPVEVVDQAPRAQRAEAVKVASEDELKVVLREILSSPEIKLMIETLIAQSGALEPQGAGS